MGGQVRDGRRLGKGGEEDVNRWRVRCRKRVDGIEKIRMCEDMA